MNTGTAFVPSSASQKDGEHQASEWLMKGYDDEESSIYDYSTVIRRRKTALELVFRPDQSMNLELTSADGIWHAALRPNHWYRWVATKR